MPEHRIYSKEKRGNRKEETEEYRIQNSEFRSENNFIVPTVRGPE